MLLRKIPRANINAYRKSRQYLLIGYPPKQDMLYGLRCRTGFAEHIRGRVRLAKRSECRITQLRWPLVGAFFYIAKCWRLPLMSV